LYIKADACIYVMILCK